MLLDDDVCEYYKFIWKIQQLLSKRHCESSNQRVWEINLALASAKLQTL